MPYKDIREYLGVLEGLGKLRRIQKPVDPAWELSCIARWMFQAMPEEERRSLRDDVLQAVLADGKITALEQRQVEKITAILGL